MRINNLIKLAFGENVKILAHNENNVLIEFYKDNRKEFATLKYNDYSLYAGNYFTTVINTEEEAKNKATISYLARCENN